MVIFFLRQQRRHHRWDTPALTHTPWSWRLARVVVWSCSWAQRQTGGVWEDGDGGAVQPPGAKIKPEVGKPTPGGHMWPGKLFIPDHRTLWSEQSWSGGGGGLLTERLCWAPPDLWDEASVHLLIMILMTSQYWLWNIVAVQRSSESVGSEHYRTASGYPKLKPKLIWILQICPESPEILPNP